MKELCLASLLLFSLKIFLVNGDFRGNDVNGQRVTDLNGTSGDICPPGRFKCITNATCINGTCVCNNGLVGNGRIACAPPGSFQASVLGDPVIIGFDGGRAHVPFPCRIKLTHFSTTHTAGSSGETCNIQVHALNYHVNDGYYVMGFDVLLTLTNNADSSSIIEAGYRKFGLDMGGLFRYIEQGKQGTIDPYQPWGPPAEVDPMIIEVNSIHDDVNNFAEIKIPGCGFHLKFRAFVRHSLQLPGIFMAVDDDPGLVFHHSNVTLCSSPFNFGVRKIEKLKTSLKLTKPEAVLYLALNQDVKQDFGFGAVPCNVAGKEFLRICMTKREKAFALKICTFIYSNMTIASCLMADEFGTSTGSTFGMCVQAMCSDHTNLCNDVRDELALYQCPIPEPFASLNCADIDGERRALYPNPIP